MRGVPVSIKHHGSTQRPSMNRFIFISTILFSSVSLGWSSRMGTNDVISSSQTDMIGTDCFHRALLRQSPDKHRPRNGVSPLRTFLEVRCPRPMDATPRRKKGGIPRRRLMLLVSGPNLCRRRGEMLAVVIRARTGGGVSHLIYSR